MKSTTKYLHFNVPERMGFVNITRTPNTQRLTR